jgi:hypothetical protein
MGDDDGQAQQPGWLRRPVSAWVKGGYSICRLEDCPSDQPSPETLIHCILNVGRLAGPGLGRWGWGRGPAARGLPRGACCQTPGAEAWR